MSFLNNTLFHNVRGPPLYRRTIFNFKIVNATVWKGLLSPQAALSGHVRWPCCHCPHVCSARLSTPQAPWGHSTWPWTVWTTLLAASEPDFGEGGLETIVPRVCPKARRAPAKGNAGLSESLRPTTSPKDI